METPLTSGVPLTNEILLPAKPGHPERLQGVRIKTYDFKRPDKFSRDQIRTISIMHETFARLASTLLSAHLRMLSHVHVTQVDQMTFEEFIRSIPNPTTCAVINMDPLKGSAMLQIDPTLTFTIIDRLFGGQGTGPGEFNRDLTDIEESLMEGVFIRLLGILRESWSTVVDLRPRLATIETNPMFVQIVPPTEMIVLVTLEMKIGEHTGMLNLCLPYLTIEPLLDRLKAQYWYSSVRKGPGDKPVEAVPGLKLDTELYYRGARLSLADIHRLKKGSRIALPGYGSGETMLENGGVTVLNLKQGTLKGNKGSIFTIETPQILPQAAMTELVPEKPENELKSLLSGLTHAFSAELKEGITGIHTEIGQLRKKQDELAEQFYFGTNGKESRAQDASNNNPNAPFGFINMSHLDLLFMFIQHEHPQTLALILAYLTPEMAGQILMRLAPAIRLDVTKRIACLDRTAPEVLQVCERVLKIKMEKTQQRDYSTAGGIGSVVEILNISPRGLEKDIIENLEKYDAEFAEEIKKRMFVFEDVVLLDKKAMKKLIASAKKEELAVALKKTDPQVNAYFGEFLTKEEQDEIRQIQETKSPLKISDIEEAQQRIVNRIRGLEEKGEIIVARPGETV